MGKRIPRAHRGLRLVYQERGSDEDLRKLLQPGITAMHCNLCISCYIFSDTLNEVLGNWIRMWSSKGEMREKQHWKRESRCFLSHHFQVLLTWQHLRNCLSTHVFSPHGCWGQPSTWCACKEILIWNGETSEQKMSFLCEKNNLMWNFP